MSKKKDESAPTPNEWKDGGDGPHENLSGDHEEALHGLQSHGFVRVGGQVINLAHVVSVDLAVGDDPKHPLTLYFVHGRATSLIGDDAAKVLGALGVDA